MTLADQLNIPSQVTVFDLPVEQTLLMPDYSMSEIQALIGAIFPQSEDMTKPDSSMVCDQDVELLEHHEAPGSQFSHFLNNEVRPWEPAHTWTGTRRGRGRPPLSGARLPARFQSDFCNKGFYYRSMLTAHEKLHTGGKRETCEVCGAEYSTRQNLKNHMIKYHGADSFTPRKRGRPPVARDGYARGRGAQRGTQPGYLALGHSLLPYQAAASPMGDDSNSGASPIQYLSNSGASPLQDRSNSSASLHQDRSNSGAGMSEDVEAIGIECIPEIHNNKTAEIDAESVEGRRTNSEDMMSEGANNGVSGGSENDGEGGGGAVGQGGSSPLGGGQPEEYQVVSTQY